MASRDCCFAFTPPSNLSMSNADRSRCAKPGAWDDGKFFSIA